MIVHWIQASQDYVFRLYNAMGTRQLLDEVTVSKRTVGKVTASPNPIPIEAGSRTMLRWEITSPASAEVCVSEDGLTERLVCRGASGTYEVTGLRSGIDYRFRLYASSQSRPLLDEIKVRLSEIPWESLLDRLNSAIGEKNYSGQLAEFIARVLPRCIRHAEFSNWFRLWGGKWRSCQLQSISTNLFLICGSLDESSGISFRTFPVSR